MIYEPIFPNFEACKSSIESDFGLNLEINKLDDPTVLLRGESQYYEKTDSSMKRFLSEKDGLRMKPFYFVSPFIDFEDTAYA